MDPSTLESKSIDIANVHLHTVWDCVSVKMENRQIGIALHMQTYFSEVKITLQLQKFHNFKSV